MTPFAAYELFLSLKTHFNNSNYNYFKYNGKVKNLKIENFHGRSDKYQFQKLAKHPDPVGLIVSNLIENKSAWIGDIIGAKGEKIYTNWKARNLSLDYTFEKEIDNISDNDFNDLIKVNKQYPELFILYRKKKISIESLIIIDQCVNIFSYWNKNINDQLIWPEMFEIFNKYRMFLDLSDKEKYKSILVDKFGK